MKHEVITFGCRLNIYESEVIKTNLKKINSDDKIAVFNSCTVTKEAEKEAVKSIRKLKKAEPNTKIIVTGCAAQKNPDLFALMDEVDKVIGNEEKLHHHNYDFELNQERVLVNDIMSIKETAHHLVTKFDNKSRAFIQVQNGCDHRCTFCIIPYARGNSRSMPIGEIVKQSKLLIDAGYKEIVLTGVDATSYGNDLPGKPSFSQMIRRLLSLVPELPRLRLSSIDVAEIDNELIEMIGSEKRLMPHIHISLQAGDDMILKRMKRRHNRGQIIDFCNKVRSLNSNVAFGADIIAGFPTETEEMFENTRALIAEAGLQYLHVFPYSIREDTPAARMPQVPVNIRKERAKILRREGHKQLEIFFKNNLGKTAFALIESGNYGHTENFIPIKIIDQDRKYTDPNNEENNSISSINNIIKPVLLKKIIYNQQNTPQYIEAILLK